MLAALCGFGRFNLKPDHLYMNFTILIWRKFLNIGVGQLIYKRLSLHFRDSLRIRQPDVSDPSGQLSLSRVSHVLENKLSPDRMKVGLFQPF